MLGGNRHGRLGNRVQPPHRRYEAKPPTRHRDDEAVFVWRFMQGSAHHHDVLTQVVLFDDDIWPDGIHQRLLVDELVGMLHQEEQCVEGAAQSGEWARRRRRTASAEPRRGPRQTQRPADPTRRSERCLLRLSWRFSSCAKRLRPEHLPTLRPPRVDADTGRKGGRMRARPSPSLKADRAGRSPRPSFRRAARLAPACLLAVRPHRLTSDDICHSLSRSGRCAARAISPQTFHAAA